MTANKRLDWRQLSVVISCISIVGLSFGLTITLVSLVLEHRGVDSTWIGIMAAIPALGVLCFSPILPRFISLLGGRTALLGAFLTNAIAVLLLAFFDSFIIWLLLRFIMGVAAALLFVISETWINEMADERNRGRLVALYLTVLSLFYGAGPALLAVIGSQGLMPFILSSLIFFIAALPLLLSRAKPPPISGRANFSVLGFIHIAPTICAGVLLFAILDSTTVAFLHLFGLRHGYPEALAALMISALIGANIASQLPLGWLADRINRYALMFICACVTLLATLLLPILAATQSIVLWLDLMLLGVAAGGIYTLAITLIGQRFRGSDLITANAAVGALWGIGGLLGPLLAGLSMKLLNPNGLVLFWAFAAALFLAVFIYRQRLHRSKTIK